MLVSPWFSVGVGAGIILCAGIEMVQEIVLRLEPGRMSPPLKWTQFISAMGAPLGWTGGAACQVLKGRSYVPRWQLYLYASAFVISGFALLIQWFGVSGPRDWRS